MSYSDNFTNGGYLTASNIIFDRRNGSTYSVDLSAFSGGSGTSGSSGVNGTSGSSGINGTSGTSGNTGTSGSSGINGTSGTKGTSGSSGINGTSGTKGTSGTSGVNGTSGSSGVNGTSGTAGSSGITGATPSLSQVLLVGNTASTNINVGQYVITNGSNNNLQLDYFTTTYLYNGSSPTNYNSALLLNSSQVSIQSYSSPLSNTYSTFGASPTEISMRLQSGATDYSRVVISNANNKVGVVTNLDSYYFPRVDGTSGQVLTTDGLGDLYWASGGAGTSGTSGANGTSGTSGGGGGSSPTSITYASLATLKSTSSLTPGAVYYISDRDIILTALDADTLSVDGERLQWVVKNTFYTPQIVVGLFTINYIGIYGQGIAAGSVPVSGTSPGDTIYRAIWGGRLWVRNSSGTDGTPINSTTLNSAWTLVTPNTTTNDWRSFDIKYDFDNDVVREQSDWKGNVLTLGTVTLFHTDWGNENIRNNSCYAIFNNWCNSTTSCSISYNSNNGVIYGNSNNGVIYYNSNKGPISSNTSNVGTTFTITNNSNTGSIINNNSTANIIISDCNTPFTIGAISSINRGASLIGAYIYNSTIGTAVSNSSNTVYTTLFTMNLVAGETYRLTLIGNHQTVLTTTGIKIKLGGTATCNVAGKIYGAISTAAVATELAIVAATMTAELITTGVSNNNTPHFHGADIIFKCTVSGTLLITFASEVNTSAAQVNIGTTCTLERLV